MMKPESRLSRAGFSNMVLQSVLAGVVLIVLVAGGLIAFSKIRGKQKEERFYMSVIGNYHSSKEPEVKIRQLDMYLQKYPRGAHAMAVRALKEKADGERGLDLVLDCSVVLHSRTSLPLTGHMQLLKVAQPFEMIENSLGKSSKISALKRKAERDEEARLELFDAIGVHIQKLKIPVVREARVEKGKVKFAHLQPGEYLVYGVARSGSNVIGIFDRVTVLDGEDTQVTLASYSAYARDAERRTAPWIPAAEAEEQKDG